MSQDQRCPLTFDQLCGLLLFQHWQAVRSFGDLISVRQLVQRPIFLLLGEEVDGLGSAVLQCRLLGVQVVGLAF